ncbi:unnamed protein product, partial [Heligmosomoides polygyrus]|uniref:PBP_domain domain-containing protein n=1 Tax=Heligmosomoides polygyrus TaxID=6339 RepID=A0A183FBD4_HELPZ
MGIYAIMDSLPRTDPGLPAAISTISMDPKISVAEQLKQNYPEAFNNGLGRYKLSKATLQLRPGVKPIFRPKRP